MNRLYNVYVMIMIHVIQAIILRTTKTRFDAMALDPICFGIPSQCFELIIETGTAFTIIAKSKITNGGFKRGYNKSLSVTSKTPAPLFFSILFREGEINALEQKDTLIINDINNTYSSCLSIDGFSFLLGYDSTIQYDIEGILGLSRYYPEKIEEYYGFDSRFSLIQSLYDNGLISKRVFAHKYVNESNGLLYLGQIPEENTTYYKCKGKDNGNNLIYRWNCQLHAITLSGNDSFIIKTQTKEKDFSNAVFYTGGSDIRLPLLNGESDALFEALMSFNKEICWIKEEGLRTGYRKLLCHSNININVYPDINFKLENDYGLVLNRNNLFVKNDDSLYYECVIIIEKRSNQITMGAKVLKNYNMIFDHQDNSVSFNRWNENINKLEHETIITNKNNNTQCIAINVTMLLCGIGIVFNIFIIQKWFNKN